MVRMNRRQFERFVLQPMYTRVALRRLVEDTFTREGHIHNASEGGLMFELDDPIEPGTPVAVQIHLPGLHNDIGPGRAVFALGTIVWVADDLEEPGPVRMAVSFTRFARAGDRDRLVRQLASGRYARAA